MGRIGAFVFGFVLGALTLYLSMHYHFVHARDGWHTIRKTNARLAETFVDIRQFTPNDWIEHPGLAAAITRAEKTEIIGDSVLQPLRNTVDSVKDSLELPSP